MGKSFVSELELNVLKRNCELEISNLKEMVKKYCDEANEIDSVITSLLKYYNTEGGKYKIREIDNIDLLNDSFKNLSFWADSININFSKSSLFKVDK